MEGQERVEVLGATTTKLLRLGFQAQQIGYRYLREAVWVVCSDPEMITSVTKLLYPEIAKRFSTTDKQVERAIRNSIETAWDERQPGCLEGFDRTVDTGKCNQTDQ